MKRLLLIVIATAGLLLGLAPASGAWADVEDFHFASFDAQYFLDRDDAGHSTLRVVETLAAVFPEHDQNRGIRRAIPNRYDGHPTELELVSVSDGEGNPREFETENEGDTVIVTIAADDFVHGEHVYVIEYTLQNVTRYYDDTDADEFYWDINGTESQQPFDRVSATVHLGKGLERQLTGKVDAVWGYENDGTKARISGLTFEATDLAPQQGLSFAIGFEPTTFTPRASGFFDAPWPTIGMIGAIVLLGFTVVTAALRATRLRDSPGRGIIVAEYLPPNDGSLLLESIVLGLTPKATPAVIVALAVTGNLRIVEVQGSRKNPKYRLEYLHDRSINDDEREFMHALFGATLTPGEHRELGTPDEKAVKRLGKLYPRVKKEAIENGYLRKYPAGFVTGLIVGGVVAAAVAIIFSGAALDGAYGGGWPIASLAAAFVLLVTMLILLTKQALDPKGVALRDHLLGLKTYIKLAEADRLRYLQSPQGALREPIATDDTAQLVKLGERLLPYAILFGFEKEWAEELGRYYEQLDTQPGWYFGTAPFTAAVFAGSITSVGASTASAYSASSGGSTGGASVGGGGGGGGVGGV